MISNTDDQPCIKKRESSKKLFWICGRNCTTVQISRPGDNQRVVYNGHKRVHAIKFQAVVIPSGLVANLYGPVEGLRHDAGILKESGLLNI